MVICSFEKKYEILGIYDSDEKIERYFCKELSSETPCCMVRIMDKKCIAQSVIYYKNQIQNQKFKDFEDLFMSDSALCMVFLQKRGISLEELMKTQSSFEERMSMFTAILVQIIMLDMDPYIACDCLIPEAIFLTQGLSVSFSHWLINPDEFNRYNFQDVLIKIRYLTNYLFAEELKLKTIPEINQFEKALVQGGCQNYLSLYQLFSDFQKSVKEIKSAADNLKPQTILFRMWEKITILFKPFKKLFILLLFIAAIAYLIYNVEQSQTSGREKQIFESIGTLEIKE